MSDPIVMFESERQRALNDYRVVDTVPELAFDEIVKLASAICGTPIALISLSDRERQWFKARVGLDVQEIPRCAGFCDLAIQTPGQLMEVRDASSDPRFIDHPLVTAAPHLRFYASMPLVTPEGAALGTLCVIDPQPRILSAMQRESLASLAVLAMELMASRRRSFHGIRTAAERDFSRRRLDPVAAATGKSRYTVAVLEIHGPQRDSAAAIAASRGLEQTLAGLLTPDDVVTRHGDHEFLLVLVDGEQTPATLRRVHDQVALLMREQGLQVSIGAATATHPDEAMEYVFLRAEAPLHLARSSESGGLVFATN